MMNIKEFLLDNYIWIIVVILLSIITVIGFLADKKKTPKKKKGESSPMNPGDVASANTAPINYQSTPTLNQNDIPLRMPERRRI